MFACELTEKIHEIKASNERDIRLLLTFSEAEFLAIVSNIGDEPSRETMAELMAILEGLEMRNRKRHKFVTYTTDKMNRFIFNYDRWLRDHEQRSAKTV